MKALVHLIYERFYPPHPVFFSIKDIALVLSQEEDTFSIALQHLTAISLMLFLCKCDFSFIFFLAS